MHTTITTSVVYLRGYILDSHFLNIGKDNTKKLMIKISFFEKCLLLLYLDLVTDVVMCYKN